MQLHEFDHEMNRLRNHFVTAKIYSDDFCKLLWQKLKNFPDGIIRKIAEEFIGSSRQAPLMPEFQEAASRYSRNIAKPIARKTNSCRHCDGDGYVHLEHFKTGGPGLGSCEHCARGAELRAKPDHPIVSVSAAGAHGYFRNKARDY